VLKNVGATERRLAAKSFAIFGTAWFAAATPIPESGSSDLTT
jgi:hypothetical protein